MPRPALRRFVARGFCLPSMFTTAAVAQASSSRAVKAGPMALAMPLATLLLNGCEQNIHVQVSQRAGVISVTAAEAVSPGPVCIQTATLTTVGMDEKKTLWDAVSIDPKVCIKRIDYPQVPSGFRLEAQGAPLKPGRVYAVSVCLNLDQCGSQLFTAHDLS